MAVQVRQRTSPEAASAWARRRRRYLNHPLWGWYRKHCRFCGAFGRIEVHHVEYRWRSRILRRDISMRDPRWRAQVPDRWLLSLCHVCHDQVTARHRHRGLTPRQATIDVAREHGKHLLAWRLR